MKSLTYKNAFDPVAASLLVAGKGTTLIF